MQLSFVRLSMGPVALVVLLTASCTTDPNPTAESPEAQAIIIRPRSLTVPAGGTARLAAEVTGGGQGVRRQRISFRSTGGAIDSSGQYVAGVVPGRYLVIGALASSGIADTAMVTIVADATGCTGTATTICPGDNIQARVNAAPPGTVFRIKAGIHRMQTIVPKSNQQFIGDAGAVLSGARLLTSWVRSGSRWYAGNQTQQFGHDVGECASGTACRYPEDVFRDDVLLRRVLSLSAVTPGTFFFDYAADRIYVGDDPAGHKLEAAATQYAFRGSPQGVGTGVVIRGLTIEKYASPAQYGAVGETNMGANWTLRGNEIRLNHGAGVRGGGGVVVAGNNVHHNGQVGLLGYFARVDSNEIAYNNNAGFRVDWAAGGAKFIQVPNLMLRGNFVHHNRGAGFWCDYNCVAVSYLSNRIEDNLDVGILHEIGLSATIANNVIRRNGFQDPSPDEGAGIMVYCSGGTGIEVKGNQLEGNKNGIMLIQADRGSGPNGPYVLKNVNVHDNIVTLTHGQRTGAVRYGGDSGLWTRNNNHFEHNTYNLQSADAATFQWAGGTRTDAQWRAYGNDETGVWHR